jgi:hypothetical protein
MKDYIQNELVCLRAMEPIGSDRYEELSKAIQWLEENTIKQPAETKKATKHNYAHTTIQWKDDGREEEAIISLNGMFNEKHDDEILFYCENEEELEKLKEYDNGEDFFINGCILFTEEL